MSIDKSKIPDIQDMPSNIPLPLERVGVSSVERRVRVRGESYDALISVFINLPGDKRGVHLSRLVRAIDEAVEASYEMKYSSLEEFMEDLVVRLLETHPYACYAIASLETKYYVSNRSTPVKLILWVKTGRKGGFTWRITVEAIGLTACPCAQAVYSSIEKTPIENTPTHMQRTMLRLSVETSGRGMSIDGLVGIVLNSFSALPRSYLDRLAEYKLVKKALSNPLFAEDVARNAIKEAYRLLKSTGSENTLVEVVVESYDSIHPHNIRVETRYTLGDLERVLGRV